MPSSSVGSRETSFSLFETFVALFLPPPLPLSGFLCLWLFGNPHLNHFLALFLPFSRRREQKKIFDGQREKGGGGSEIAKQVENRPLPSSPVTGLPTPPIHPTDDLEIFSLEEGEEGEG